MSYDSDVHIAAKRNAIAQSCTSESVICVKQCLKICYWNIHGWSSTIIGNKLADTEFLGKISDCDIVALSEIHSDKEVSLPGFISIKQKIRKKLHRGPKIAGA